MRYRWRKDAEQGAGDGREDARAGKGRSEHLEQYSADYREAYEKSFKANDFELRRAECGYMAPYASTFIAFDILAYRMRGALPKVYVLKLDLMAQAGKLAWWRMVEIRSLLERTR